MAVEQLDVEHLFTLDLQVAEGAQIIKGGPHGTRIIAEVAGGTFTGERLNGSVVSPGGDWVTARADRNIQLDVRLTLVTDDDAFFFLRKGLQAQRSALHDGRRRRTRTDPYRRRNIDEQENEAAEGEGGGKGADEEERAQERAQRTPITP